MGKQTHRLPVVRLERRVEVRRKVKIGLPSLVNLDPEDGNHEQQHAQSEKTSRRVGTEYPVLVIGCT